MSPSKHAPTRRNQADRSAQTRRRILDAVVACIEEEGFARTTSQRIARRAGVSVGAVQHHFMSKADMLRAVLEESFDDLSAAFDGVSLKAEPLDERVAMFVDRAWAHYGTQRFRSTLEIIFGTRDSLNTADSGWAAEPMLESRARTQRLWDSVFSHESVSRQRQRDVLRFAFVNLAGLSLTTRFEPNTAQTRRQLSLIKDAIVALLGGAAE